MKVESIFMNLSKAFDSLNHGRLLAKFKPYCPQPTALKQMENYLRGHSNVTRTHNRLVRKRTFNHLSKLARSSLTFRRVCDMIITCSYLTGRFQRTKVNNSYSSWSEIIAGVPPRINFRTIYIPRKTFLSNYADDNTLYSIANIIESVKKALSNDFRTIENWFHKY